MPSYQVPVMYDGKKIIPGPRVSIQRDIQRSADGSSRQRGWRITLSGEVVAFSGSPRNDGTFWTGSGYPPDETVGTNDPSLRIRNVRNKLKALTDLFSVDGKWFEVQPGDASASIKAQVITSSIKYNEGLWFDIVPFTVEMEATKLYFGTVSEDYEFGTEQKYNLPEESWSVEPSEDGRSTKLTHTISASGKKMFEDTGEVLAEGWEVARAYILGPDDPDNPEIASDDAVNMLGVNNEFLIGAGVLNLDTYQAYNYVRSNQVDTAGGRYSVTESWLCIDPDAASPTNSQASGRALEELNVDIRYASDTGFSVVSLNGSIIGLEERNNTTQELIKTKWENAELRNATVANLTLLHTLAESYSGVDLNPSALTTSITKNKISGIIQYSVVFDTRPSINASYLSEIYTVTLDNAADVFAEIGVVGRPIGPILQDIGSKTRKAISMNAEILVRVGYGLAAPIAPVYNPLIDVLTIIGIPNQIFLASDQENWTPRLGRYSRRTTYVYQ